MGFPEKLENLNFGDPERSKSVTEILDAEYLVNGVGYRVQVNKRLIGMHRLRIGWRNQFDIWWPWKVRSRPSAEKQGFRAR